MSERLPADVDRMLWEIAESQDSGAYDDFERRFPHLVGDLGKRIQLVRELREARGSKSARPLPRFDRRVPAKVGPPTRLVVALASVVIACLGFAAFVVTGRLVGARGRVAAPPNVNVTPPAIQNDVVLRPPTQPTSPPALDSRSNSGATAPPTPPPGIPAYLKPQALVKFDRVKLQMAILAVATSGSLDVEFAPNMPNPDIRMEYRNMSALDILKDLGPRFKFTAFSEGGRRVLIVPATDPNAAQLPPASGSGFATTLESDANASDAAAGRPQRVRRDNASGPS